MKYFLLFLFAFSSWLNASAVEYRSFTSANGKIIRARILKYNESKAEVTLERENKRSYSIPLATLSADDQQFIQDWNASKDFLDERSFRISIQREKIKDKASNSNSIAEKQIKNYSFKILLDNRSATDLKDLTLEYCIYYDQENFRGGKLIKKEGIRHEKMSGITLPHKKKLLTEIVKLQKLILSADAYYTNGAKNVQEGTIHGIILKITTTSASGKINTRMLSLPESLVKKRSWSKTSVRAGLN